MRLLLQSSALVVITGSLATVPATRTLAQAADVQVVRIRAERFTFTPSEIRVKAGTPVQIELQSDDTAHGFRVLGTEVNIEIPKRSRGAATVTFTPAEGRHTFECSKLCGAGHSFMRGVIIASKQP